MRQVPPPQAAPVMMIPQSGGGMTGSQCLALMAAIIRATAMNNNEGALTQAKAIMSKILEDEFEHSAKHAPIPGRNEYNYVDGCFYCENAKRMKALEDIRTPRVQPV